MNKKTALEQLKETKWSGLQESKTELMINCRNAILELAAGIETILVPTVKQLEQRAAKEDQRHPNAKYKSAMMLDLEKNNAPTEKVKVIELDDRTYDVLDVLGLETKSEFISTYTDKLIVGSTIFIRAKKESK